MKESNRYDSLVMAIFDAIEKEYERLYWNKHQKEALSPFRNEGVSYKNKVFQVDAYNWNSDDDDINFCYEGEFFAAWYKHAHRALVYWRRGKDVNAEYLNRMLIKCLASMKEDFERKE